MNFDLSKFGANICSETGGNTSVYKKSLYTKADGMPMTKTEIRTYRKKLRNEFEKVLNLFANLSKLPEKNEKDKSKKASLLTEFAKEFNSYYKSTYELNDYTFASVTRSKEYANNSVTKKLISDMLFLAEKQNKQTANK